MSLSPLLRPINHHQIGPSPRMPAIHADSSSESSISSSPIQSPATNPSRSNSPRKDNFDLPPPAYAHHGPVSQSFAFSGSIPVKIPPLVPRASPVPNHHVGSHSNAPASNSSTAFPAGGSIDTLRYARKSGLINSVTSPNALLPRCACGRAAGHSHARATSKERGNASNALDSGFSHLALGPSVTSHEPQRIGRIVSDSAASPTRTRGRDIASTGHNTPQFPPSNLSGSLLSRSRSDPIPPSPKGQSANVIAPIAHKPSRADRGVDARRASHAAFENGNFATLDAEASTSFSVGSPRRGRSREKQAHQLDDTQPGLLNHPPDREHPPSRSRPRKTSRRRSDEERERERERERQREREVLNVEPPQIMPSWSRRASTQDDIHHHQASTGAGVVPLNRKFNGSGAVPGANGEARISPGSTPANEKDYDEADQRRKEEMKRASDELGAVYGLAAGATHQKSIGGQ